MFASAWIPSLRFPWHRALVLACISGVLVITGSARAEEPPSFVLAWGSQGLGQGQFESVGWVAVDALGHVLTTDDGTVVASGRVQVFTSAGVYVTE